ncbi:enoyl-CoA hydratase-related protein [Mycobacterium sp.]|uniref:enoyl-CoA hydratase-related protein n=1 Tax=Mycobacterium sp. TaxID=1785 RepID=UPI003BA97D62
MTKSTVRVGESGVTRTITIDRPQRQNSINGLLLEELGAALDRIEADPKCRVVVLAGYSGFFCTGMDFEEAASGNSEVGEAKKAEAFMSLLNRLSLLPKTVIACIDGKVNAGGIGFVAASDYAVATPNSTFSLSEALWGLLPACVAPYLIRRTGFQAAYWMSLSTWPITADEAKARHLVDEVSGDLAGVVQRMLPRLARLDSQTVADLKAYFRKMWIINAEMEGLAVGQITRLMNEPRVRNNIRQFVEEGYFPWSPR